MGRSWSFNVGPFDVLVTGTRFELGWSPVNEELKLPALTWTTSGSGRQRPTG
ncbi:hypothetical protein WMF04_31010 [Sorangium sp. So ce260]|uniref:hypothetical protein n=1 Tax=Sorangium sp. So ce260 TaxID=3133291 RepID=UPI003F627B39